MGYRCMKFSHIRPPPISIEVLFALVILLPLLLTSVLVGGVKRQNVVSRCQTSRSLVKSSRGGACWCRSTYFNLNLKLEQNLRLLALIFKRRRIIVEFDFHLEVGSAHSLLCVNSPLPFI